MIVIRLKRIFTNPIDEIVKCVNESLIIYTTEEYTTEEISTLIFDRLISEGVSARIICYSVGNKPFYSVQYYKKGKWINFDYYGMDSYFQPVFNKTLKPTNIIKEEMVD
jgi:hypothetical protein